MKEMRTTNRYEDSNEIRKNAGAYVTLGAEAVKVETLPQKEVFNQPANAPKTKPQRRRNAARRTKIAVSAVVIVAAIALISLLTFNVSIMQVNADNNAVRRSIEETEKRIEKLNTEVNEDVSLDEVYEYIETEGLVKAQGQNP